MLKKSLALSLATLLLVLASPLSNRAAERVTGPWDLAKLKQTPAATWGERKGLVQEVFYEGEPFGGKPTRVFAYYARPEKLDGKLPAMVCVHGGGGKAFAEWATLWAQRGYVALAMDLAGVGPDGKRLPDGGPGQGDTEKFRAFTDAEAKEMWTYHAVAAVIRGHSLLASRPEVDAGRIGITGISWGGYLTCIVSGLDDRLKVSVPVYGCGFLHENSAWLGQFAKLGPEQSAHWVKFFDPSIYLPGVSCPILFLNGTTDFAYPLDSYQKCYRLVTAAPVTLGITPTLRHSHLAGWAPVEIGLFADSVLSGGAPLPRLGAMQTTGDTASASASFEAKMPITKAQLHFAPAEGAWQKRSWTSVDAVIKGQEISAKLPAAPRPLVYFLTVTDPRGATVSTPHTVLGSAVVK